MNVHNYPRERMNPYVLKLGHIKWLAQERTNSHVGHSSTNPWAQNRDMIGAMGEWQFALMTGIPWNTLNRPEGDSRVDFVTSAGDLDVKTGTTPYDLLRPVDVPHAEILVLAHWKKGMDRAVLLGWEYDQVMQDERQGRLRDDGPLNYMKNWMALRSMYNLYDMLRDDRVYKDPTDGEHRNRQMYKAEHGTGRCGKCDYCKLLPAPNRKLYGNMLVCTHDWAKRQGYDPEAIGDSLGLGLEEHPITSSFSPDGQDVVALRPGDTPDWCPLERGLS